MSVGNGQSYALFEFTAEDSTAEIKITVSEFNDPPLRTIKTSQLMRTLILTLLYQELMRKQHH